MSAVSRGATETETNTMRNMLIGCASLLFGSAGFVLSVLAALLQLVYTPSPTPLPDVAEHRHKRLSVQSSRPSHNSKGSAKQNSISSSNASTLVPSTPPRSNSTESRKTVSEFLASKCGKSDSVGSRAPSTPRSRSADSRNHKEESSQSQSEDKRASEEQIITVTVVRSLDDLDTPTTLVDSPVEESHQDGRRKLCSCRARDPSKKCNGRCLFRALRKTSSTPSCLSPPASGSSELKRKSQPRLRTQPYEAPYFAPTPDSVQSLAPKRPTPSRSQTMPPPEQRIPRSQTMVVETRREVVDADLSPPKATPKRHITLLLPKGSAQR